MTISEFDSFDKLPVFMAATPEFVEKSPETVVAYLKAWLEVAKDFKEQPKKVADTIYSFYTSKGYKMAPETFAKALARVEVAPGWPADIKPYMTQQAEILVQGKEDQGDARLEQGAAHGIPQEGRRVARSAIKSRGRRIRAGLSTST